MLLPETLCFSVFPDHFLSVLFWLEVLGSSLTANSDIRLSALRNSLVSYSCIFSRSSSM